MTCICHPSDRPEGNTNHSASCNRYNRKLETDSKKQAQKKAMVKKPIAKVGTKNTFECSDGTRVTDSQVRFRLGEAYYQRDALYPDVQCEGCEKVRATCHAHIIAKARCKQIGKTELIWDISNFFNSCWFCNSAIENPKGQEWKKLKNIDKCLKFIEQHDAELFVKFSLSRLSTEPHKI